MLGVADMNLSRASGDKITQIMQSPNHGPQAVRAAAALRATPPLVVAALSGDLGFRQILDARDALRGVRAIPSWSRHDDILHNLSALEMVGVSGSRSAEKLCKDATLSKKGDILKKGTFCFSGPPDRHAEPPRSWPPMSAYLEK